MAHGANNHVSQLHRGLANGRLAFSRPQQPDIHGGQQLIWLKWFGEIVVGTHLHAVPDISPVIFAGKENKGYLRPCGNGAYLFKERNSHPFPASSHPIRSGWGCSPATSEGSLTILSLEHPMTFIRENPGNELAQIRIIFNDQYGLRRCVLMDPFL